MEIRVGLNETAAADLNKTMKFDPNATATAPETYQRPLYPRPKEAATISCPRCGQTLRATRYVIQKRGPVQWIIPKHKLARRKGMKRRECIA